MKKGVLAAMLVVVLLIGLVSGFYLSGMSKNVSMGGVASSGGVKKGDYKDSFEDGWRAAKDKFAESNPTLSNVYSLNGKVKEVRGQELVLDANLINPLDDESLKTRTVVIGPDTKISVWRLKTSDQLAKDQREAQANGATLQKQSEEAREAFMSCSIKGMELSTGSSDCESLRVKNDEAMKRLDENRQKMDIYQKIENASLSDIKAGWNISVSSLAIKNNNDGKTPVDPIAQYENIASASRFNAGSIEVRELFEIAPIVPASTQTTNTPVAPVSTSAPTSTSAPASASTSTPAPQPIN